MRILSTIATSAGSLLAVASAFTAGLYLPELAHPMQPPSYARPAFVQRRPAIVETVHSPAEFGDPASAQPVLDPAP